MFIVQFLLSGQRQHQRLMLDTVLIERKTQGAFSNTTGEYATTWAPIYAGPADVKVQRIPREQDAGQTATTVERYDVVLPFTTGPLVKVEDRVTPTASLDAHLVGRVLFVFAVGLGSRRTAWHITAIDQEQP